MEEPAKEDGSRDDQGRFVKGVSGNPKGKPKGAVHLSTRIRRVLLQETSGGKKVSDVLAEVLVREALKNPAKMWQFIKEFMDRDEGRTDRLDILNQASAEEQAQSIREALEAMDSTVGGDPCD